MSSPKIACLNCGTEILQDTENRTGELCLRCRDAGVVVQSPGPPPLPPPRQWRQILADIHNREDLLGPYSQELFRIPLDELPLTVRRWMAAHSLMVLGLGNGWTDVVLQYMDDFVLGMEGFAECGFAPGVEGARRTTAILASYGLDWRADDFYISIDDDDPPASRHSLPELIYNRMYDDLRRLDDELMSATWAVYDQLENSLIARARELAA